jgi:hypothetical protein
VLEHLGASSPKGKNMHSEGTTTRSESASTIDRLDQAAWEAPQLRETYIAEGAHEEWAHPCPDWCLGTSDLGHDAGQIITGSRWHRGPELRVRQDAGVGYDELRDGKDGIRAAHIEARLVAASREMIPKVQLRVLCGDRDGKRKGFKLSPLYPDEVRELIGVLQHLLKVAQA